MSGSKLVNIDAVKLSTPLPQVYRVAVSHDNAVDALSNVKDSIFACVRAHARKVYEKHLGLAANVVADLAGDAMRAEFKNLLDDAESEHTGSVDKKAKGTWNKNKTDLGRALGLCYDFVEMGEKGSSFIVTWCKDTEDAIEDAANAKALEEHLEKHPEERLSITKSETKDVTVDKIGGDGKQADAGGKAVASATGITFANSEQEARFNEMIELMAGISKIDPSELDGMINGSVTQLTAKNTKLLKLFAKAS